MGAEIDIQIQKIIETLSDDQFQKIIAGIKNLKSQASPWDTFIPIFASATLAFLFAIFLEFLKNWGARSRADRDEKIKQLAEINACVVALGHNLTTLIHIAFQNVIPHFRASKAAFDDFEKIGDTPTQMSRFLSSVNEKYTYMLFHAPEIFIIESDYLEDLKFVMDGEPDLLQHGLSFINYSRMFRSHLQQRSAEITQASSDVLRGVSAVAIGSIIQKQYSLSEAECLSLLTMIDEIMIIKQILERVGTRYRKFGKPKKIIPPEATGELIKQLQTIVAPVIQRITDQESSAETSPRGAL